MMAALTFVFLAVYGYAMLFDIPYLGFLVEPPDSRIYVLSRGSNEPGSLLSNDLLVSINDQTWHEFTDASLSYPTYLLFQRHSYQLHIQRGDELKEFNWIIPGINILEFLYRLLSIWWLPFAFWLAGVVVSLQVRPRDVRWRLLFLFFYLAALAVSAGVVSTYDVLGSTTVLRSAVWLILPVSWHLHWMFPKPLAPAPKRVLWVLYGLGAALTIAEWFHLLPRMTYLVGFMLMVINSFILMVMHLVSQPDQRRNLAFYFLWVLAVVFPTFVATIYALLFNSFPVIVNMMVWILPGIPVGYIYLIYTGRVEGMELRSNRLITVILYSGLLLATSVILTFLVTAIFREPSYYLSIGIAMTFLLGLATLYIYPVFQRWFERKLLDIPMPPTQLLERYTARVTTSLGTDEMIHLLRNEALPSLLIRQAALIRLDASLNPSLLFKIDLPDELLPTPGQIPTLLSQAGQFPRRPTDTGGEVPCKWALLVISLAVSGQTVGICLLGKRDPDDTYTQAEINTLQALMDQTALALINFEQAEQLRVLYQKDIERQEAERSHLARELHDDVLNQLGMLWMSVDERQTDEHFAIAYQTSVTRIREIISGLRPGMLMYGLRFALEELTEETATQVGGDISIQLILPPTDIRYPPDVELHLFRIVQQACKNALKHSQAQGIYIRGQLDPGRAELLVEDDGVGFVAGENLDLARLLANKHFGLAGMHERAALIGARMTIDSAPGEGTRVRVEWSTNSTAPV